MDLIDRLKIRLEISGDEENALLEELLISAEEVFLSLRYPVTEYPVDDDGNSVVERRWDGWIVSAAVELYNRKGIEGEISRSENGVTATYDSSNLSTSLRAEVIPVVGVVGGG